MKKLLSVCLIFLSLFGVFVFSQKQVFANEEVCQVIATSCYLYEEPGFDMKVKDDLDQAKEKLRKIIIGIIEKGRSEYEEK